MKIIFHQKIAGLDQHYESALNKNCKFNLCVTLPNSVAHYRFKFAHFWTHFDSQLYGSIYNNFGLTTVLEYSIDYNQNTCKFASQIADYGVAYNAKTLNTADAGGHFELTFQALNLPHFRLNDYKFKIKKWILKFLDLLPELAWLLTQKPLTLGQGMK